MKQSNLTISDIHFNDFKGTTSGRRDPYVGTIVCSSPDVSLLFLHIPFEHSETRAWTDIVMR